MYSLGLCLQLVIHTVLELIIGCLAKSLSVAAALLQIIRTATSGAML